MLDWSAPAAYVCVPTDVELTGLSCRLYIVYEGGGVGGGKWRTLTVYTYMFTVDKCSFTLKWEPLRV